MDIAYEHMDDNALIGLQNALGKIPTADVVEAVHGEWKQNNLNGFKIYDCSNCGVHMEAKFNYCPFCGADMRGERNEQIH